MQILFRIQLNIYLNKIKMSADTFTSSTEFCSDCGTILSHIQETGGVICFLCKKNYAVEAFGNAAVEHDIIFNPLMTYERNARQTNSQNKSGKGKTHAGPIVERKCPKCGNDKMSYATVQLRSADEGQTVFYTCTKCEFKETENS